MEQLEYRTDDKSDWGNGPWRREPDKMQWPDPATGLPCLLVRNRLGALCGYVGVDTTHPWHGIGYAERLDGLPALAVLPEDDEFAPTPDSELIVHGGVTFSGGCHEGGDERTAICHRPGAGEPDDIWWFGFDCLHAGDYIPTSHVHARRWPRSGIYRDVAYVQAQCAELARQLVAIGAGHD